MVVMRGQGGRAEVIISERDGIMFRVCVCVCVCLMEGKWLGDLMTLRNSCK